MAKIEIDGVFYAPVLDAVGDLCIVVLDKGWVFVGRVHDDEENARSFTIKGARNIRSWSSTGFGGLVRDPGGSAVKIDDCERDIVVRRSSEIFRVPVPDTWNE